MADPIESAKVAILAWMESDEAMALVHLSNDSEFDEAISAGQARAAITAYRDAEIEALQRQLTDCRAVLRKRGHFWNCEGQWCNECGFNEEAHADKETFPEIEHKFHSTKCSDACGYDRVMGER